MESGLNDQASSLRPLRAVADVLASLRGDVLDGTGMRRAILQIADAVERALRLLLRDDTQAATEVRLRSLAAEELRADELLAQLRQHARISIKLAAAVHELFQVRRRLEQGSALEAEDSPLAVRVAHRLEVEILRSAPPEARSFGEAPVPPPAVAVPASGSGASPASPSAAAEGEAPREPAPRPSRPPLARAPWPWLAAAGVAFAALVAALLLLAGDRSGAEMDRGIALFRSGAYADAAAHFWRYAEANPRDLTPRLYLARIHRRMERYELAAGELERAIALAPEDAGVQAELGHLLLDTGRSDVAVERFRAALRIDPESAGGWIGLVRALRGTGRSDAAERVLAQAPAEVRELFARRTATSAPRP